MYSSLLLIGAALAACVSGEAADESSVPRDNPLPGNYAGDLRPQIHFSPPQKFMNDPNGMFVDADGLWHLYYQCERPPSIAVEARATCVLTPVRL